MSADGTQLAACGALPEWSVSLLRFGLLFELASGVERFLTHLSDLLLGPHVDRLLRWPEFRSALQLVLRHSDPDHALALVVRRNRERAIRNTDVLFANAEEPTDTDHNAVDPPGLVEEQVIDAAEAFAGVVCNRLTNEQGGEPLALRLNGNELILQRLRPA